MLSPTQFSKFTSLLTIPLYLIIITEIYLPCLQLIPHTYTVFIPNIEIFTFSSTTVPCLLRARYYSPFPWASPTPLMSSNIEAPTAHSTTLVGARAVCGNCLTWPTSCAVCEANQDTAGPLDCHTDDSYCTCWCYILHRYTYFTAAPSANSSWPAWWSPTMKWFHPWVREELQKSFIWTFVKLLTDTPQHSSL